MVGVLAMGCAREASPPGGPPDRLPPIVISSEPDTFSTVEPFRSPVTFRFSERISERPSAGTLDQSVVVSPASGEVRVSHGREGLAVRVPGGFEAGHVYRLTVLPVIQDMFGNPLQEPYELFFSTGPEFTSNVVAGSVVDRLTGEPLPDVRVDAAVTGSDVVHTSVTDSAGIFAMRYLPAGEYVVSAYLDRNRNGEPDFAEPQGTRPASVEGDAEAPDTTIVLDVPLLPNDTTAAQLVRVTVEDSVSLNLSLDDYIDPELPLDDVRVTVMSDSTRGPRPLAVLHEHEAEAYRRALADSIARERAVQDSVARAQADSTARPAPVDEPPPAPAGQEATGNEEPARPRARQTIIVILDGVLVPEVLYEVEVAEVTNINGVGGGGGTAGVTRPAPEAVPADTAQAADSLPPDTIQAGVAGDAQPAVDSLAGDTIPVEPAAPGDTLSGDSLAAPADSMARDTIPVPAGDSVRGDTIPVPPGDSARRDTIGALPTARSPSRRSPSRTVP